MTHPQPIPPADLLRALRRIRSAVRDEAAQRLADWAAVPPGEAADSAANMAAYLALRRHDLRGLQPELTALGLSSLGRVEGHVAASLDATIAALAAVLGAPGPEVPPPRAAFAEPSARLAARRDALFGPGAAVNGVPLSTRIMVTLPSEAADDPALIADLIAGGADALRINCAHDDAAVWAQMLARRDAAAAAAGRPVPVEMDLGGPKLRISDVVPGKATRLHEGDRFTLALTAEAPGKRPRLILPEPALFAALTDGAVIGIDDGKITATVEAHTPEAATCRVVQARSKGWKPKAEKGVNLIGTPLDLPALSPEDRANLPFILEHADLLAYSFVQTVGDVTALLEAIGALAPPRRPALVLKIETPRALANLPDLIAATLGHLPVAVMIARGDLAVEIGLARLSEIQEEILWLCESAQVPVIWATQVLEGLVKEGQASRAETTDAAMSQRAECVMLNKGPHIRDGLAFLRDVLRRMERHSHKKADAMPRLGLWPPG